MATSGFLLYLLPASSIAVLSVLYLSNSPSSSSSSPALSASLSTDKTWPVRFSLFPFPFSSMCLFLIFLIWVFLVCWRIWSWVGDLWRRRWSDFSALLAGPLEESAAAAFLSLCLLWLLGSTPNLLLPFPNVLPAHTPFLKSEILQIIFFLNWRKILKWDVFVLL